ncbi:Uma2 family endonuclease [Streptomyces sp. URMC 129]|uniref:Uma2 family endonuclease n=1 Tax=Streptomyces sp. URMC 129 TaxID=3423407 RepID=UPI003F1D41A4
MTVMMERPTIRIPAGPAEFEELRRVLDRMEVPEGYRAEIIRGGIRMTPWSQGFYLSIMDSLTDQLRPHVPDGHRVSQAPCLYVFPGRGRAYGPDVHVADAGATHIRSTHLPGEALALVAELTSESTADVDRADKVEVYGKAGVPVYVLVDMLESGVTVFSQPDEEKGYQAHTRIPFGKTVHIPAPFDCELDTSGWES